MTHKITEHFNRLRPVPLIYSKNKSSIDELNFGLHSKSPMTTRIIRQAKDQWRLKQNCWLSISKDINNGYYNKLFVVLKMSSKSSKLSSLTNLFLTKFIRLCCNFLKKGRAGERGETTKQMDSRLRLSVVLIL